ncbi:hypothetical protein [Streptomyces mirabilis]
MGPVGQSSQETAGGIDAPTDPLMWADARHRLRAERYLKADDKVASPG